MTMLDNIDIEMELNAIVQACDAQINQLSLEAQEKGVTVHALRNEHGDPTLMSILHLKMNTLHTLIMHRGGDHP